MLNINLVLKKIKIASLSILMKLSPNFELLFFKVCKRKKDYNQGMIDGVMEDMNLAFLLC